jgi:protease I
VRKIFALAILLFICCGGGGQEEAQAVPSPEAPVTGEKSVLMVIAPKDFRDEEFKEPYDIFSKAGLSITVASTDTASARGMLGMVVKPDMTLEQVDADDYDALVIVGGRGCEALWDNTTLHAIVRSFDDSQKTIGAICIAPVVLARAGVLKDKKATVYPSVMNEVCDCGAEYTKSDIEIAGNIITCSGPESATAFGTTILRTLSQ